MDEAKLVFRIENIHIQVRGDSLLEKNKNVIKYQQVENNNNPPQYTQERNIIDQGMDYETLFKTIEILLEKKFIFFTQIIEISK